jgi:hypothetical protein
MTMPCSDPAMLTLRVTGFGANVAVTVVAALTVTVHLPAPLHPPLHPMNVEPVAAVAVSVTAVPLA